MKLNLDVIADYLPTGYRVRRYGAGDRRLVFTRPLLYEKGTKIVPDRIYVSSTGFLPNYVPDGSSLICVGGRLSRSLLSPENHILHIENTTDIMAVFWDIYAIYDRFDTWDEELRDLLENNDRIDMEAFLTAGVRLLGNRIGISDYNLHTMFTCGMENDVPCYKDLRDQPKGFGMANLEGIRDVALLEREIHTPYLSAIPGLDHDSYCQNIYSYSHFLGCAYISSMDRSFRESDFPLMDHFLQYFCKLMLRYFRMTATGDSEVTAAIRDILDGKIPHSAGDPPAPEEGEMWLCFRLKERKRSRFLPQNYMCEQLRMFLPGKVHVLFNGDGIIGIVAIKENTRTDPGFEELLTRMGYVCGISNPFREMGQFLHFYDQASFALECSLKQAEPQTLNFFGRNVLQYMLSSCTGNMPAEVLYPPGLVRLMSYDRKRGTDYVHTLRMYLRNESNASRTAEQLYVHRNSFLKRMDRIEKILEMDLDDADTRLLLRICLRLVELS